MAVHVYHIDKFGPNPVELINGWELDESIIEGYLLMEVCKRKYN